MVNIQLKRVGALLLTLAMLVGMVSVMGAFPVAAASAVETFKADFSALSSGIVSTTDTATVEYLEDLFAFYYFQEGWSMERSDVNGYVLDANGNYLTGKTSGKSYHTDIVGKKAGADSSQYVDGTGNSGNGNYGISKWLISGKYIAATAFSTSDCSVYRKANTMWVKADDGDLAVLDNFNLEMDFKPADSAVYNGSIGANTTGVGVFFRAKNAGQVYGTANKQLVHLSPEGGLYVGSFSNNFIATAYPETMQYNDSAVTFNKSTEYHLSMRVVGTQMYLNVTESATQKVVYELTRAVEDMEAGYLGIGGSNAGAYYGNIEVTRLDKNGEPVDFNDHNDGYGFGADFARITDYRQRLTQNDAAWDWWSNGTYFRDNGANVKWLETVEYNSNTYDFSKPDEYAADKAVVDYLNSKFDFYYNREGIFTKYATPYENSVTQDADADYGKGKTAQWKLQNGRYLNAVFTAQGGELFRKTVSLVPKDDSGTAVMAANVETEFDMNLATVAKTGLAFTFRAKTAGQLTKGYKTSLNEKITVVFTSGGWAVYEGVIPKEETVTPVVNAWKNDVQVTNAHVYIKAVGNTLFMKVTAADGTVYYEGNTTLTYAAEGYMFYSALNGTGGFANIRANRLDELGNQLAWNAPSSLKVSFTSANGNLSTTSADYAALNDNFNAYYDADGSLKQTYWASNDSDGVFNYIYGKRIQTNGGKYSNTNANAYMQYVKTLSPKVNGTETKLKNFELSFTTYWANVNYNHGGVGAIVVGLRQKTAGKFTDAAGKLNKEQGMIIISPKGITIAGGNDIKDEMYYQTDAQKFDTILNPAPAPGGAAYDGTYHTVKVRVIGSVVEVWIDNDKYTGTVDYDEYGYLSFGVGGSKSDFGNISITRLDDAGNVVDWKEEQQKNIPTTVTNACGHFLGFNASTGKYPNSTTATLLDDSSLTVAQRSEFLNFMNNRFDVFYNDTDGTYIAASGVTGNKVGYNYDEMMFFRQNWLRPNAAASGYGEVKTNALEDIGSLVFKDDDGERLYLKNMEINTAFEQEGSSATGSNIIAIRQETPGKYFGADGSLANGTFVQFSNGYVYVYENGEKIHEQYCAASKPASVMSVQIRVIGNTLTYTLTTLYNNGGPYTGTVTLSTARYGYVAFSQTNWRQFFSLSNTSVTALDDAGNPTPIKEQSSKYRGGDVQVKATVNNGVYTNVITVKPNEGYQLLAGSLVASDASGNRYIPTRVGFREDGKSDTYQVVCNAPVSVSATFIEPTLDDPNIGNIGTSINPDLHGLRFVSRFARTVDEGKEYITLNGETVAVKDYGMLVGLKSVIGNETLDMALTAENKYVLKVSIPEQNKYYDFCDEYVDMSLCIVNLQSMPDGLATEVVARAFVIVDDGSEDGLILYAPPATSSYEENADIEKTSFEELVANEQVVAHGRAALVNNEYQMDWVNTGFEVKGTLSGPVKVKMTSGRADSLLNVIIDDGEPTIVHVPSGTSVVTLAKNLQKGQHTVKVISGTSIRFGVLTALELQYTGTLDTVKKDASRLKIEVLGDSISCGWGLDGASGNTYTTEQQVAISNSYYSYAAQTARLLDADFSAVAQCAQTIPVVHGFFPKLNKRTNSPAWDFANNQQDIVLINLGTNDEWQGTGLNNANYTAEKSLANIKALLSDVREAYPDAYIIYVYGMMRKTYEAQYQQAINEMNDDKAFYIDMSEYVSTGGYDGNHPKRDSHTAVANKLASFIRTNCSELFGHTTHTDTMATLTSANKVVFTDRTAADGTGRGMTYSNTGLTVKGYLYGDLKMNVNVGSNVCALNVIVDGELVNTVWAEAGTREVTLLEGLRRGEHTVEILKGTAHHAGRLVMKDLTYTGTLATPTAKSLKIEFIGDSVTVGEGMYGNTDPLAKSYNAYDGYAAQVGRYFDAQVTTIAQCGQKIPAMTDQYNNATDSKQDIVVINMGTNDFGWSNYSDLDIANDYYPSGYTNIKIKDAITGLIDDVREKQPNAYIIWGYGMMFDLHIDALEDIITEYATATNDDKLLFCDLSAAKDNTGKSSHPSTIGNNNAALVLAGFIRENCEDLDLPTTSEVQKTYATDRALKVACVGDSITAGGYWENNLGGELSTTNYTVSGFGKSGSTAGFKGVDYVDANTNAGKAYVDQTQYTSALAYGADVVVMMLGTNDSKKVNWPVYADEFVADYVKIVRSFQELDSAPMVFIALPPTVYSTGSFQDISNFRIENFIIPALKEVAAQTGAILIDTHTPTGGNSSLMTDGVHPGSAGKQILCETIAAAIKADTGRE